MDQLNTELKEERKDVDNPKGVTKKTKHVTWADDDKLVRVRFIRARKACIWCKTIFPSRKGYAQICIQCAFNMMCALGQ